MAAFFFEGNSKMYNVYIIFSQNVMSFWGKCNMMNKYRK